jgi:hypothetical protein
MLSDVIESIAMMQQMQYAALRAAALAFVCVCFTPCACTCSSPCPSCRRSSARRSCAARRSATPSVQSTSRGTLSSLSWHNSQHFSSDASGNRCEIIMFNKAHATRRLTKNDANERNNHAAEFRLLQFWATGTTHLVWEIGVKTQMAAKRRAAPLTSRGQQVPKAKRMFHLQRVTYKCLLCSSTCATFFARHISHLGAATWGKCRWADE